MTPNEALKDIQTITSDLISYGLSDHQNFPSISMVHGQAIISFDGHHESSKALKNISYEKIYTYLLENRQYNIKLLDGGLLQFLYCFEGDDLIKHRLCYFPSPSFEPFQNEPEIYLDDSLIYADITLKSVLPVPVRFDYAPNDAEVLVHPASHLTLGQYKNCRIPVSSPLCPSAFSNFIIRAFYFNATLEMPKPFKQRDLAQSIDEKELEVMFLSN